MEKWGKGWDYTFQPIWENLDRVRDDNLERRYDNQNIDFCFNYLYALLLKEIIKKIKVADWERKDKVDLLEKTERLITLFKKSKSYPDKVIAINMAEQFLRAIY